MAFETSLFHCSADIWKVSRRFVEPAEFIAEFIVSKLNLNLYIEINFLELVKDIEKHGGEFAAVEYYLNIIEYYLIYIFIISNQLLSHK